MNRIQAAVLAVVLLVGVAVRVHSQRVQANFAKVRASLAQAKAGPMTNAQLTDAVKEILTFIDNSYPNEP